MSGVGFYNLYAAANWFTDQMSAGLYLVWQLCQ